MSTTFTAPGGSAISFGSCSVRGRGRGRQIRNPKSEIRNPKSEILRSLALAEWLPINRAPSRRDPCRRAFCRPVARGPRRVYNRSVCAHRSAHRIRPCRASPPGVHLCRDRPRVWGADVRRGQPHALPGRPQPVGDVGTSTFDVVGRQHGAHEDDGRGETGEGRQTRGLAGPHFSPHEEDRQRCATAWNKQCSEGRLRSALLVPSSGTRR